MTLKEISDKKIKNGRFISVKVETLIVKQNRYILKTYVVNGRYGVDYSNLKQNKDRMISKELSSKKGGTWFKHTDITSIVRSKNYPFRYYLQLMNPKYSRIRYFENGEEVSKKSLVEDKIIPKSALEENKRPTTTILISGIKDIIYREKRNEI